MSAVEPQLQTLEVTSRYYEALKGATEERVAPVHVGSFDGVAVVVNPILPDGFELWRWSDGLSELYRQSDGVLIWRGSNNEGMFA